MGDHMPANLMCEKCGLCFVDDDFADNLSLTFVCGGCKNRKNNIFKTNDIFKTL